ncbi:MAG: hypothetical protein AB1831_03950 [Pseudomonadota bacterium]
MRLIAKACEARIPRSGPRGEQVNCYVVALDRDDSPYFIATAIHGDNLEGLLWNGSSYADSTTLTISDLDTGRLNITHYYGLSEVTYDNIYDVALNYITKLIYLKIKIYRRIDSTYQYFFNKRKLVTKRRMELLRLMMDDQFDRTHDGISSLALMTRIYSMHLFLHPSWEVQHRKVVLYLDSLVRSGELRLVNDEYVVTGQAISTIERYEEEERRHTEAVKLQKKMFWLTIIAVIFAIVQSGFIKLPTVIDLSKVS